jgi:hypothetical protein
MDSMTLYMVAEHPAIRIQVQEATRLLTEETKEANEAFCKGRDRLMPILLTQGWAAYSRALAPIRKACDDANAPARARYYAAVEKAWNDYLATIQLPPGA